MGLAGLRDINVDSVQVLEECDGGGFVAHGKHQPMEAEALSSVRALHSDVEVAAAFVVEEPLQIFTQAGGVVQGVHLLVFQVCGRFQSTILLCSHRGKLQRMDL